MKTKVPYHIIIELGNRRPVQRNLSVVFCLSLIFDCSLGDFVTRVSSTILGLSRLPQLIDTDF